MISQEYLLVKFVQWVQSWVCLPIRYFSLYMRAPCQCSSPGGSTKVPNSHSENLAARHSSSVLSNLWSLMNWFILFCVRCCQVRPLSPVRGQGQGREAVEVQRKSRRKFCFSLRPFPWQITDTQDLSRRWLPCCEIYGSNVASIKCPRKWSISLRCICWVHTLYLCVDIPWIWCIWILHGYSILNGNTENTENMSILWEIAPVRLFWVPLSQELLVRVCTYLIPVPPYATEFLLPAAVQCFHCFPLSLPSHYRQNRARRDWKAKTKKRTRQRLLFPLIPLGKGKAFCPAEQWCHTYS